MTVYVIACLTVDPDAADDLKTYMDTTMPLLEAVGGRVTQNFPTGEMIVGNRVAEAIMVVEYPNIEAVHALFDSEEYRSVIPARDRAFRTYSVSIVS